MQYLLYVYRLGGYKLTQVDVKHTGSFNGIQTFDAKDGAGNLYRLTSDPRRPGTGVIVDGGNSGYVSTLVPAQNAAGSSAPPTPATPPATKPVPQQVQPVDPGNPLSSQSIANRIETTSAPDSSTILGQRFNGPPTDLNLHGSTFQLPKQYFNLRLPGTGNTNTSASTAGTSRLSDTEAVRYAQLSQENEGLTNSLNNEGQIKDPALRKVYADRIVDNNSEMNQIRQQAEQRQQQFDALKPGEGIDHIIKGTDISVVKNTWNQEGKFDLVNPKTGQILEHDVSPEDAAAHAQWYSENNVTRPGIIDNIKAHPLQTLGILAAGYGIYQGMSTMLENGEFGFGSLMGMATSIAYFFERLKSVLDFSNTQAGIAVAAILLIAYLVHRFGSEKDNEDTEGSPAPTPTPDPSATASPTSGAAPNGSGSWTQWLPSQNVFMILASVAALAVGAGRFNLSSDSAWVQAPITINQPQLPRLSNNLAAATGKPMPASLLGRVFVKQGDGMSTPDKAIYVSQVPSNTSTNYRVNMVSLNAGGYMVGVNAPDQSLVPFWLVEPRTGAVMPNPEASDALARLTAMGNTATGPNVSWQGAYGALDQGGASGRWVDNIVNR